MDNTSANSRILVGACSWSDHKNFYPEGMKGPEQISYYAQRFPLVEVDVTFYRMLPRRTFAGWAKRTPDHFTFDVKAYRQMTWHDEENPPDQENTAAFAEMLKPLGEAGKLGAILLQLAPWVKRSSENLKYLQNMREWLPEHKLAVEFRHRSWLEDTETAFNTLDFLSRGNFTYVSVDEPQLGSGTIPSIVASTTPTLSVLRLHGRNYKTWYGKHSTTGDRFDYLYNEEELEELAERAEQLATRAREVHVLFNNNQADYAVRNAIQMSRLLRGEALEHATE